MRKRKIKPEIICLAVKKDDRASLSLAGEMEGWLAARGLAAPRRVSGSDFSLPEGADLVLSIGGDGSMISVARSLAGSGIPLAGVNTGRVGFLPALSRDNWRDCLALALEQGWEEEKRLVLALELLRGGEQTFAGKAVNDVVISRGGPARLPDFEVLAEGQRLLKLRADGLIISTPTGSSAYSCSAGGPLLHPGLNVYSLTSICPFQTRFSPLVLDAAVRLDILTGASGAGVYVTVDGQEALGLRAGDLLRLRGLPGAALFARLGAEDYFSRLRSAGFIADSPGA